MSVEYKRIFSSRFSEAYLRGKKPYGSVLRRPNTLSECEHEWVIEGDRHDMRSIDAFVARYDDAD